jgi:small-conductance mechanosensitive channel
VENLVEALPSVATIVAIVVTLIVVRRLLDRGEAKASGHRFRNQVLMILLTAAGLLILILVVPIGDAMRGQVLGLIGILLSAAIALSSTTVLGNAMAGMMMRAVRNFRTGDFIRVGDHFGRVSERGLFHTEIQTEERELTTLPNLYLVTSPVTTIRSSGTIVSTRVSLGYDVPRTRIESLLVEAAKSAGLEEPFVHVLELGDFSVTYRVAGLLAEVKRLLSVKSRLRECVMDSLHEGGVEIVSPSFMNTRALPQEAVFIPRPLRRAAEIEPASSPEDLVFDKAEEAESLESLRLALAKVIEEIEAAEDRVRKAPEGAERDQVRRELAPLELRKERLQSIISSREAKITEEKQ